MKRTLMAFMALAVALMLGAGGCASDDGGSPTPGGVLSPEEAFDSALSWLRDTYKGDAPAAGLKWSAEEVDVTGPGGQPLVGAATKRIYSGDWDAEVSWAVVAPEYLNYAITLKNPALGWYWEGYVAGKDGALEEAVSLRKMNEALALEVATGFMKSSPTFLFDGMDGTLVAAGSRKDECTYCWSFAFGFQSAHAGYGNRTGQMLAEVITPHQAVISVQNMRVTSAVMDEQWDMLAQKMLK